MNKTVQEKIKSGDYNTKLSSTQRDNFTTYFVYSKGSTIVSGQAKTNTTPADIAAWRQAGYTVETSVDEAAQKDARRLYQIDGARLQTEFEADLAEENNLTGHPKAARVYALAVDFRGDSRQETADAYEALAQLVS